MGTTAALRRDCIFASTACAIPSGEPNCALMSATTALMARLPMAMPLVCSRCFLRSTTGFAFLLLPSPPPARKPRTAAAASPAGEASLCLALRPVARAPRGSSARRRARRSSTS